MKVSKENYEYAQSRIDALLPLVNDDTPMDDPLMKELMLVTDIVEAYEDEHVYIPVPTVGQIISNAMEEHCMTGKELAHKIGVSPSRISDFINDKAEPSLRAVSIICRVLNINPVNIIEAMNAHVQQEEAVVEIA